MQEKEREKNMPNPNRTLSIPESKKLIRRLRMDELVPEEKYALDYFHGFSVSEVIAKLRGDKVDTKIVTENYVMRATGRLLMAS